ncbi:MAG: hypothetical protein H6703_11525 [Myxococcales bacterium]|nr:hypothetical protein [Myxococcales bacterium]
MSPAARRPRPHARRPATARQPTAAPRRRTLALLAALLLLPQAALAAPAGSDAARLNAGLPPGFRRPQIVVYPLVDQRPLALDGRADPPPPPPAWDAFLDALRDAPNLAVETPALTVRALTDDLGYRRALELAQATADRAYRDYREVRLDAAAEGFDAAVDAWLKLEHHVVAPREVARAALTRGLALLEAGDPVAAERALRQALLIDPALRLRPGYDQPRAIEALDAARQGLLAEGPPAPDDFSARTPLPPQRARAYLLRARVLPDRLEVTLRSAAGVSVETEPLDGDPIDAGSRLASRVRACLPFGWAPRTVGHRARLFLDAGFDSYAFAHNPVEAFPNVGVAVHLSWLAAARLSLDLHASLATGERDPQEHLRQDIATARLWLGPGYDWQSDRFRATAHVGVEVATMSPVVLTTNAACKYWPPGAQVPPVLCDHDTDIDRFDRAWLVGPAITLGGTVRLVDQIYLALRVTGATYLFESADNGFGRPIGGSLALGYRLF